MRALRNRIYGSFFGVWVPAVRVRICAGFLSRLGVFSVNSAVGFRFAAPGDCPSLR
jgi:hypothetical protein